MPTFKSHFTQEAITKISLPKTKQDFYNDTKEKGLFLIVGKSKTFYLRKTVEKNGRSRTIKLGTFPYMLVVEARNKAAELKNQISKGIPLEKLAIANNQIDNQLTTLTNNPIDDKLTKLTVKEFFYKYIEEHSKRKNKSWKNDIGQMNLHGKDIYDKKISTVTRDDIQKTFTYVNNNSGPIAANRFYSLLSSMFNRAIEWDFLVTTPTNAIEQNKEISRARYVATKEEMSRLVKAIAAEKNRTMAYAFLMLLFTGARRGNVVSMKWQDINFENETWSIPAKSAKNKKTQSVHLVNSAISILTRRKKESNSEAIWVFPSDQSKGGHITSPDSIWKKICKLANIKDLRIHDLRRTHGSWMRKVGADREIIGEALGHKDKRSTEVYDIIAKEQVREFQNKAAVPFDKILKDLEFFTENEVVLSKETKEITDNIELNNIIESMQSQIKAQQRMIEELTQQIRN